MPTLGARGCPIGWQRGQRWWHGAGSSRGCHCGAIRATMQLCVPGTIGDAMQGLGQHGAAGGTTRCRCQGQAQRGELRHRRSREMLPGSRCPSRRHSCIG